jgi:hypothetical protein
MGWRGHRGWPMALGRRHGQRGPRITAGIAFAVTLPPRRWRLADRQAREARQVPGVHRLGFISDRQALGLIWDRQARGD